MLYEHLQLFFFSIFPPFVKRWIFSRTCCMCWGGVCWNSSVYMGVEARDAGILSLICCRFSRFWALVAPGLVSSEQESPVPPSCVLGLSVAALKQLYILLGVSLEASSIFCLAWPRFTKWSVYACHTEINLVFSMESQLFSHLSACRWLLTGSLVQESTKQKAVDGQWTPHISPGTLELRHGIGTSTFQDPIGAWGCWQQRVLVATKLQIKNKCQWRTVNNIVLIWHVKEWHRGWVNKTPPSWPHHSCFQ